MQPNWDKTLHLRVGHSMDILTTTGTAVTPVEQAVYLGSLLSATGRSSSSVGRRIGEAKTAFSSLCDVWKHASISKARKIRIYEACIITKLTFSLECECLRKADKARIDAFHCKCLRRILKVPPSWISRVSNTTVLEMAKSKPLSNTLLKSQLVLFGNIAMRSNEDPMRQSTFKPNSLQPASCLHRKRGRPRLAWQSVMYAHASSVLGTEGLSQLLLGEDRSMRVWKQFVAEQY